MIIASFFVQIETLCLIKIATFLIRNRATVSPWMVLFSTLRSTAQTICSLLRRRRLTPYWLPLRRSAMTTCTCAAGHYKKPNEIVFWIGKVNIKSVIMFMNAVRVIKWFVFELWKTPIFHLMVCKLLQILEFS